MDAEKKLLEEISFAVFATGPGLNDLSETARIEIDEKLVEKHCTLHPLDHHESPIRTGLPVSSFSRP